MVVVAFLRLLSLARHLSILAVEPDRALAGALKRLREDRGLTQEHVA
jgi:hypothetical protein